MHPIRLYRLAKGLTQQQLADLVGVNLNSAHRWEMRGMPRAQHIVKIAETLGIEPVKLIQEIEAFQKEGEG